MRSYETRKKKSVSPKWVIVLGENPSIIEKTALVGLQKFLLKKQGVNIKVVSEKSFHGRYGIIGGTKDSSNIIHGYVNQSILKASGAEGYHLKTYDNNILIQGYDARGVLYGTYQLEHLIEDQHDIPESDVDEAHKPFFKIRMGWMGGCWLGPGQKRKRPTNEDYDYFAHSGFNTIMLMNYAPDRIDDLGDPTFYAYSKVFPDFVPKNIIERNRAEIKRRIGMAEKYGLDVYLHINSPIDVCPQPERMTKLNYQYIKTFFEKHPEYFETNAEFCRYGCNPDGSPFPCLSMRNAKVIGHYKSLIKDILKNFPEVKGLRFWPWDMTPGNGFLKEYPFFVNQIYRIAKSTNPQIKAFWWDWGLFDESKYEHIIKNLDKDIGFISCADEPFLAIHDIKKGMTVSISRIKKAKKVNPRKEIMANDMLIQAEDLGRVNFVPDPIATYEKLKTFTFLDILNLQDYYGIVGPDYLKICGTKGKGINEQIFWEYLWDPYIEKEILLKRVAKRSFGKKAVIAAIKTWQIMDDALSHWIKERRGPFQKFINAALGIDLVVKPPTTGVVGGWLYQPITFDSLKKTKEKQLEVCRSRPSHYHYILRKNIMSESTCWKELSQTNAEIVKKLEKAIAHADKVIELSDSDKKEFAQFHSRVIQFVQRQFRSCYYYSEAEEIYQLWEKASNKRKRANFYQNIKSLTKLEISNRTATIRLIRRLRLDPAPGRPFQYVIPLDETEKSIKKMKDFLNSP